MHKRERVMLEKCEIIERVLSNIEVDEDGCWIWQKQSKRVRYAQMCIGDGVPRYVHRLLYETVVAPIPDGLDLDHLCRKTWCVNPGHMEPVTHRENCLRGQSPWALNARRTRCLKCGAELTRAGKQKRRECEPCGRAAGRSYYARNRKAVNERNRRNWAANDYNATRRRVVTE